MGIFSNKKKTYVGTTVARAIQDDALPNAIRTGLYQALFNEQDLPANIMEAFIQSLGIRGERYFRYGRDSYVHGLPTAAILDRTQHTGPISAVLAGLEGAPIEIEYSIIAPPNYLHLGWQKLVDDYDYDADTNQIGSLTTSYGYPFYLDDMQIVVPVETIDNIKAGGLDQWGVSPKSGYTPTRPFNEGFGEFVGFSPVIEDPAATNEYLEVTAVGARLPEDPLYVVGAVTPEAFEIHPAGYDDEKDYVQVKYRVGGAVKYWTYEVGLGTYPTLDDLLFAPPEEAGTFFPWAYFRFNKGSNNDYPESADSNRALLNVLDIDYDTVHDTVHENPDIGDVEQAMLIMAVPPVTENELERRYLFQFFDNLFQQVGAQFRDPRFAELQESYERDLDLTRFAYTIEDNRFRMILQSGGIYKNRKVGTKAAVGEHFSEITYDTITIQVQSLLNDEIFNRDIQVSVHHFYKQVSLNLYDEIRVVDLEMVFRILEKHTATGDDTDPILLIPLDHSITQHYTIPEREELYARSLHMVFNSVIVVKIKWYESTFFSTFLIAVAIVITIVSFGTGFESLIGAIAVGTTAAVAAAVWVIIQKILIGLVIGYALKIFVKEVGIEASFVIALLLTLAAAYQGYSTGSLQGAPWATELLQLSTGLSQAINENLEALTADLIADYSEFDRYVEEQLETLESAQKLLQNTPPFSPFLVFGETPEEFYNRTVHSGNIGIMSVAAISNYVDAALTLPELNETIGGTADGG